jgi:hypothetical protein
MTTKQAMKKIKEMMSKDGKTTLYARCEALLNSGGIDKGIYPGNEYTLPKIILYCALLDLAEQYRPLYERNKAEIKNLRNF